MNPTDKGFGEGKAGHYMACVDLSMHICVKMASYNEPSALKTFVETLSQTWDV